MTSSSVCLLFAIAFAVVAVRAQRIEEPKARSSPAKIALCSCDDQQRFFKEEVLSKALQQSLNECRDEVLKPQLKQLFKEEPQQQKVEQCFQQEYLRLQQQALDCVNEKGRDQHKSCSPGNKKGEEIVNMPASQMLAYFIDGIYTKVEEQLTKIAQAAGEQHKFGPVYQKQIQCFRQRFAQKLQQIDTAATMQCEFNFSKDFCQQTLTKECMTADRVRQTLQQVCQCASRVTKESGVNEFCEEAKKLEQYFPTSIFDSISA